MAERLLIRQAGGSLVVTIPAKYLRLLGWEKGDVLRVDQEGATVVVSKENR